MRLFVGLALSASVALCETYYVSNRAGDDRNGGTSKARPFASIRRATSVAKTSDHISLANTGLPYREPIVLRGLGGTPAAPFIIEGNGATISGLKPIKPSDWKRVADDQFFHATEPRPYGFPFLVHQGKRLPQASSREAVKPGEFFWGKHGITFRTEPGKTIENYRIEATLVVSGLAVSSGSYITCRNLISEYHSNDGFNLHGDCRGTCFENIEARHNGDDGFSVHECIGAVVRNAHLHHNRWGIQDVNASRSVFNGVTAEHNEINGANFVGGYHSLVDCIVRHNGRDQIAVTASQPRHLVGSAHNPLCATLCFLQNVVTAGGSAGLSVRNGARVTATNCVFLASDTGVAVQKASACHLTACIVARCRDLELHAASEAFFRDHNLYHPGRFRWHGKTFRPEQWEAYRAAAGHEDHSAIADTRIENTEPYGVPADSPASKRRPRVGPTQPVRGYVPLPHRSTKSTTVTGDTP